MCSLSPTPAPTLRNKSVLLKHPTYPSVALYVPDVIPLPRHHERVHRHLPAQPRREAFRSVHAAACGQCFRNPLHVLPAIEIKRHSEMPLHTFSKNVSGFSWLNISLHVITVTRSSVFDRLMILCVHPGIIYTASIRSPDTSNSTVSPVTMFRSWISP